MFDNEQFCESKIQVSGEKLTNVIGHSIRCQRAGLVPIISRFSEYITLKTREPVQLSAYHFVAFWKDQVEFVKDDEVRSVELRLLEGVRQVVLQLKRSHLAT